jgi:hypothetical protein
VESLPQFEQLFEGADFRKGMELAFTSTKAGGLAARIDSRDVRFCTLPSTLHPANHTPQMFLLGDGMDGSRVLRTVFT